MLSVDLQPLPNLTDRLRNLQHEGYSPKTGQYIGMYGKSHRKVYITDLSLHAGYISGRLIVLFCRKPVFPLHTTTSQILIYLASPKYG